MSQVLQDYWRVSLGLDYAFTESTLAMVEYHYNGAGSDDVASYLTQTNQIPYTQGGVFLLGENYIIPAISIQLSPLLDQLDCRGYLILMINSTYLSASLNYNVKEDLYIGLGTTISEVKNSVLQTQVCHYSIQNMVLTPTTYSSVSAIIFNKISKSTSLPLRKLISVEAHEMFWAAKGLIIKKPRYAGLFFRLYASAR